jgi:hypothetical protein
VSNGSPAPAVNAEAIARRLAAVLGDESALAAVYEALHELGYADKNFSRWEQSKVLEWLAERPGLVGTAARRARHALGFAPPPTATRAVPQRPSQHRISTPPPGPHMIEGAELVGMFARALGDEKARETIETECQRLRLNATRFSIASALSLLDGLAKTPGIIGVTARFAKARLSLRQP